MTQGPIPIANAVTPSGGYGPLKTDAVGNLLTGAGVNQVYNLTAATVVKGSAGRISRISVIVAGSAAGSVNDCATTGAVAVANEVYVIPNTAGIYSVDWPCATGITVTPGTGQTLAVSYV